MRGWCDMIEFKDPWHCGITREAILAQVAEGFPKTKQGLFDAAMALYGRVVYSTLQDACEDIHAHQFLNGGDAPLDDLDLSDTIPETMQQLLSTYYPDVDRFCDAATDLHVGRWKAGVKPGALLSAMGISAHDYDVTEDRFAKLDEGIAVPDPVVSRDDVTYAWRSLGWALESDRAELSKTLGMSASTISNYLNGKTSGAKCNSDQATALKEICEGKIKHLTRALDIFSQVK